MKTFFFSRFFIIRVEMCWGSACSLREKTNAATDQKIQRASEVWPNGREVDSKIRRSVWLPI